ncbi:MAG TPA: cyclic beta 1-2 glucan synthetase, partial [Kiritimatiellia bacterium]|nr:cyclic beta 1-2 glucan synthetase [Kiritimatiellia bacterium]
MIFPLKVLARRFLPKRAAQSAVRPRDMPDVIEEPLRAELLSVEQLKRFAQELARTDVIDYGPGYNRLLPRLADNAQALRAAHQVLVWADGQGRRMAPPAEWLLDNFYLIEQQIQLARIHLPKRYSRQLPRLAAGPRKGFPRVYDMAFELIAHLDGLLDEENTAAFVAAYQTVDPLQLGELWAFPIALRLGLIENLRRVAVLVARRRQEKDDGIRWAERVQSAVEKDPKQILHLLAEFADAHTVLSAPFLEEFVDRLQGQGPSVGLFLNWIDQMLAEEATTVAQKLQRDSHIQAAEHLSISNSIGSLRFLSAMDWKRFVESQSLVERILERDPAGIHAMQDFATRDHYRHVVESLALSSGRAQPEVAELALSMASAVPSSDADAVRRRHIGFYLVGAGRARLRRVAGCRWSFKKACVRLVRRCRLTLYLGTIATFSLLGAAVAPWLAGVPAASPTFWLLALAAAVPASSLAISLVNFFVTLIVPPHPLPRLDFSRGIPEGHRTFVVV